MELVCLTSELMPEGRADFTGVIKYPMIKSLVKSEGKKRMLALIVLLVKDFCSSVNVVRNMNEDQMIETAQMLLDECDNFRMEDFVMMFSMAKRGKFHPEVKIMDRIDIQLVAAIMDCYWEQRRAAGNRAHEEEVKRLESFGNTMRIEESMNVQDQQLLRSSEGLQSAIEQLRSGLTRTMTEDEAKADIHKPPVSYEYGKDKKGNDGFIKKENS